jgi:hypothetical protein
MRNDIPEGTPQSSSDETTPGVNRGIWEWLCLGLLSILIGLITFRPIFAVDLFWHLQLGHVIASEWSLPTTDLFSAVHPESAWVQFQWLWEWLAYLITHHTGLVGLRLTTSLLMIGSFLFAYHTWRKDHGAVYTLFLLSALMVLFGDRFRVRPDMMNLVFFVASLPLLLEVDRFHSRKGRVVVFLLACLWSNFHGGGSLLLVACTGAMATGTSLDWMIKTRTASVCAITHREAKDRWLICLVATIGVLANPALIPGVVHFLSIFGAATEMIPNEEWFHTYTMWQKGVADGFHLHFALVAALPYLIGIAYLMDWIVRRRRSPDTGTLSELVLCLGLIFLSHHWVRTAYLAVFPLGVILRARTFANQSSALRLALGICAFALVFTSYHYHIERGRGGLENTLEMTNYDLEPTVYPKQAAEFIQDARLQGKLFNEGKWGGYLIWKTWPSCTVFFDTRHNLDTEMWGYLKGSLSPLHRPAVMDAAFQRYETELMVFRGPVFPLYEPPSHWILLYRAGRQEVYQHAQGPNAGENLRKTADYLRQNGQEVTTTPTARDITKAVVALGASQWLRDPWRIMRIQETQGDIESEDSDTQRAGIWMRARRRFQGAAYEAASEDLYRLLTKDPENGRALYLLSITRYLLGDISSARGVLERLAGHAQAMQALKPMEGWWASVLQQRLRRGDGRTGP